MRSNYNKLSIQGYANVKIAAIMFSQCFPSNCGDHMICLFFIDDYLNGNNHLALLPNNVVPTLANLQSDLANPKISANMIGFRKMEHITFAIRSVTLEMLRNVFVFKITMLPRRSSRVF